MGGAAGPKTAENIAEFCDGWMPLGELYDFEGGMSKIKEACKAVGRNPSNLVVSMFLAKPSIEKVEGLPAKGCSRAIFYLPAKSADVVLPTLDGYTKIM